MFAGNQVGSLKKYPESMPRHNSDLQRIELSMHSEGRQESQHEPNQRFFSFNQSFTGPESDKLNQQKGAALSKLKVLEDEVRSSKLKSGLWDKARAEIVNLSRFLKLSSLDMGCSDSSLLKQFFESVGSVLAAREGKSKDEKSQLAEAKRKEMELFQKLVESNKRKYQLQQTIVQHEHEISKLTDINESLREKSRAQSTERSSKIKEFHEETILTIHQKELELSTLQSKNDELKRQVISLQNDNQQLIKQSEALEKELSATIDKNQVIFLQQQLQKKETQTLLEQLQALRQEYQRYKEQSENQKQQANKYMKQIVEYNIALQADLLRKAETIQNLKGIIQEVRSTNNQYLSELEIFAKEQQIRKQQSIQELLKAEAELKQKFKHNYPKILRRSKSPEHYSRTKLSSMLLSSEQQILI